jgi:methylmalonyl-CoA/ethylmalonyl-CoA epimerase
MIRESVMRSNLHQGSDVHSVPVRVRFDHIAIGMPRITDALPLLVGELGGVPHSGGPSPDFRWAVWRFDGGGHVEVIEPRGEHGFLHRFLAQRGPGIHHVTFLVPSLSGACAHARSLGYDIVGYDDSEPAWKTAFLHPRQALGIVVQLAEGDGSAEPWEVPRGPPDPPRPVTVLGLRLRARSRARATTQWETLLGGEPTESDTGELVYRWPDSAMRIVVALDATAAEGPECIEVSSHRALFESGPRAMFRVVTR